MNDHGLEQMVYFPTREKNTLDLILTTLPGEFQDVHSPDKLSDHDIVSETLKIFIPWITPEIRREIRRKRKIKLMQRQKKKKKKQAVAKFEILRREINAHVRKQHDLYVNNFVDEVKANPRDFYQYQ